MTFHVRPAIDADIPKLGDLAEQLVATHHAFDAERFLAVTPATQQGYGAFLGRELRRPDRIVLVAADGADILGYVYADVEDVDYMALRGPAGVIHDIVVDAPHRRDGVGEALFAAAIDALKQRGVPQIVLSTAAKNTGAQHLFTKFGFRPTMIEMTLTTAPQT